MHNAWDYIKEHWNSPKWEKLPEWVTKEIGLDSRLGICSGMLVTKTGSEGLSRSIAWLNRKRL